MTSVIDRLGPRFRETLRGMSYASGLLLYLRNPHTPAKARAIVETRLSSREQYFLWLARHAIYGDRASPYLALLQHVGCSFGDLERLVLIEGLEGALATLCRRGVYLSHAELMGSAPVIRGSLRLDVSVKRLRSRLALAPIDPVAPGTRTVLRPKHLAMFSGLSANAIAALDARRALGWSHALWTGPAPPSGPSLCRLSVAGRPPPVWFGRYDPHAPDLSAAGRRLALWVPPAGRLVGARILKPVRAPLERPTPIVEWLRDELAAGRTPHLATNLTLSMTVARLAEAMGVDLTGARFSCGAEALTRARADMVTRLGGVVYPQYGAEESGMIASGCLNPSWPDEMHLLTDTQAVIPAGDRFAGSLLRGDELLFSSLARWWPVALLNVSLGDRADFSNGSCGCPMEQIGWSTRIHTVRAFRKLKVGIEPIELTPILKLLEQTLPERFGGGPLSYQLVGLDDAVTNALIGLLLVVDPAVGEIDEAALVECLSRGLEGHLGYLVQYRNRSGWITVERRTPYLTSAGKILQICHKSATSNTTVEETLG